MIQSLVEVAASMKLVGLIAKIRPDNYASLRAFAANGFTPVGIQADLVALERD